MTLATVVQPQVKARKVPACEVSKRTRKGQEGQPYGAGGHLWLFVRTEIVLTQLNLSANGFSVSPPSHKAAKGGAGHRYHGGPRPGQGGSPHV